MTSPDWILDSVSAKRAPDTPSAADADTAPNELTLALAHHLNEIKDKRDLSLRGLAALTGLSHAYMRRVLTGNANIGLGMLLVIARALNEDPLKLISPIQKPAQKK
ncbi:MAG: helix-turn-helix domain-containing protein [Rhodopila sp.]